MHFKENKTEYKRKGIFALLIVFTTILQNTNGLFPEIYNTSAMLIIPLVISISMFEKETDSMFLGLIAGLCWDFYSARADGFYTVLLTVAAFLISYLMKRYMRNNIVTAMVYCVICSVFISILYWFFFVFLGGTGQTAILLLTKYLPSVVYTAVLTPLYYFFIRMIYLRYCIDEESADI